jgi:hypothetical protein
MAGPAGHGLGPALRSLDFLGDLDELRTRAQRLLPDGGPWDGLPRREGTDASGAIRVSTDAQGRVDGVGIDLRWRQYVAPERFAEALFTAYTAAVRAAHAAAAAAAVAGGDGHRPPAGRDGMAEDVPPDPSADHRDWLTATWHALNRNEDELARLARLASQAGVPDGEQSVSSPDGCLTAVLRGAEVVGLTGDTRRIRAAGSEHLRDEAMAVFVAARRAGSS